MNEQQNHDESEAAIDKAMEALVKQLDKLMAQKAKECPRCHGPIGKHPALSRRDNKTHICSCCGVDEAMEDAFGITEVKDRRLCAFRTRIVKTRGADDFPQDFLMRCLERHANQDWGDLCAEDKKTNDDAVKHGARVLSCYELRGDKLWIITEADRSVTTLLTPDEY
jgi:hypothetical protein